MRNPLHSLRFKIIMVMFSAGLVYGQAGPRYSSDIVVDLCGTWTFVSQQKDTTTIEIPGFYTWKDSKSPDFTDPGIPSVVVTDSSMEAHFLRTFDVPGSMLGKRIFLHFESVNFISQIFINDQVVHVHRGGYVPFDVDITDKVSVPDTDVELKVEIEHDTEFGLLQYSAFETPLWPVGYYDNYLYQGITDSVWLAARPVVYIDDVHVVPSVDPSKTLGVSVTLVNTSSSSQTIRLSANVEDSGFPVLTVMSNVPVTLNPGQILETPLQSVSWTNPIMWTPDNPHLYHLEAEINGVGVSFTHTRGVRFGFREFSQIDEYYYLNATRFNLRGDNVVIEGDKEYWHYLVPDPTNWSAIVDSMLGLNFNCLRLHHSPARRFMLDICDEKGMLVIAESPVYSRGEGHIPNGNMTYIQNSSTNIRDWVTRDRNHASVVMWSPENEMWIWGGHFNASDLESLGDALKEKDTTRPIIFEGDHDLNGYATTVSYHYPFGFNVAAWPSDIISELQAKRDLFPDKPFSLSEFDWYRATNTEVTQSDRMRRQCVQTRAARIVGIPDIRPYRLDWSWHPNSAYFSRHYEGQMPTAEEVEFLANTMNPVAVFDKAYFRYDFDPAMPVDDEGTAVNRTLVIFNDELSGTDITVTWRTLFGENEQDSGSFQSIVLPGRSIEHALSFTCPISLSGSDTTYYLELSSSKGGQTIFTERLPFRSRDAGIAQPSSASPLSVVRQGKDANITWQEVTTNRAGAPITISEYILHMADDANFSAGFDSVTGLTGLTYTDDLTGIVDDPDTHRFYRVVAVDDLGLRSEYTETIAVITQEFVSTTDTDFNTFALFLQDMGVSDAQGIVSLIPGCTSVASWSADSQGFRQYIPELPAGNFSVSAGEAFLTNNTEDTTMVFIGELSTPSYTLKTGFNLIMHPFDKSSITMASDLVNSHDNFNGAAFWDTGQQAILQYIPGVFDFPLICGKVYYVSVSSETQWPLGGTSLQNGHEAVEIVNLPFKGPHAVWGKYDGFPETDIRITAQLGSAGRRLTSDQPWIIQQNGNWIVQCAGFSEGWNPGDTLIVDFYASDGQHLERVRKILTDNPVDSAGGTTLQWTGGAPEAMQLLPAYPNPFNPSTSIPFALVETGHVTITIYNLQGQRIRTLVNEELEAGSYEAGWNGVDDAGNRLSSGTYLILMKAGTWIGRSKVVLVK